MKNSHLPYIHAIMKFHFFFSFIIISEKNTHLSIMHAFVFSLYVSIHISDLSYLLLIYYVQQFHFPSCLILYILKGIHLLYIQILSFYHYVLYIR